jgi:integrase
MSIQERGGRFQLRVKHRLLPKPFFFTFTTEAEAEQYRDQLKALLARGIVPEALLQVEKPVDDPLLLEILREYRRLSSLSAADEAILDVAMDEVPGLRVGGVTPAWADHYVHQLKVKANLAPGTIRKRVGALARMLDWHIRRTTPTGTQPRPNPLRTLPKGYSTYSRSDAVLLEDGRQVKHDMERDRRLLPAEEARVVQVLELGGRYGIKPRPELRLLFQLIVDTGLRLSEAYGLRAADVNIEGGFFRVLGSKRKPGQKPRWRVVPLKPPLAARLSAWLGERRTGLVFSYWDGDEATKKAAGEAVAQLFERLWKYARLEDFTEHDLRHEACCRWLELRDAEGRWVYSEVEICRIMGWTNFTQMMRYASLRGEDFAARIRDLAA